MKKILKVIIAILCAILFIVLTLFIILGISVHDKTDNTSKKIIEANKNTSIVLNEYAYNALNLNQDKEANFLLTEEEMNYLLYSISKNITIPNVKIKSIYTKYNNDKTFNIYVPAKAFGFNTCLKLKAELNYNDETISLNLYDLSIGKLSSNSFIIKNFIIKKINLEKTSNMLKEKNIYIDLRNDNKSINATVTKDYIFKMLDSYKEIDNYYLYKALINEFIGNDNLINFDFNNDEKIGVSLYLKSLVYTNSLEYNLDTGLTNIKENIKILIDNKICNISNVSLIYDYLVRGYDNLSDNKKELINNIDLSSIGINNISKYKGIKENVDYTMKDLFKSFILKDPDDIIAALLNAYYEIYLPEEKINGILNNLSFIGTTFAFENGVDSAYITINSMFLEILDNKLYLYFVVDINGTMIYAKLDATSKSNGSFNLVLNIDDVTLGDNSIDIKTKEYLLKYLEKVINLDFLKINSESSTIELDFVSYITDNEFFQYIINKRYKNNKIILSSDDNGKIIIRLSV